MYIIDTRVRYSEADSNEMLSVPGIINYFQDAAIFHSKDLGAGTEELKAKNLAWIVCSWQIDIEHVPAVGDYIEVCTFPYQFKGLQGLRNCFIRDKEGNILVKANCIWALMNTETLKPERIPNDIASIYPLEEKLDMEYLPRKVILPTSEPEVLDKIVVSKANLDSLGHVNNGQYVQFAMNCYKGDSKIKRIRTEYSSQAHENDIIIPKRWVVDNITFISLTAEDGSIYASVSFEC